MTNKRLEVRRVAKGFNQNVSLIQSTTKSGNILWTIDTKSRKNSVAVPVYYLGQQIIAFIFSYKYVREHSQVYTVKKPSYFLGVTLKLIRNGTNLKNRATTKSVIDLGS